MECRIGEDKYVLSLTWGNWKKVANAGEEGEAITAAEDVLKESIQTVNGEDFGGELDALEADVVLKLIERIGNPVAADPAPLAETPSPVEAATK